VKSNAHGSGRHPKLEGDLIAGLFQREAAQQQPCRLTRQQDEDISEIYAIDR
jgi:hypothetical protein